MTLSSFCFSFFFFNDTATTEIYTLSLHDALPISFFALAAATCSSTGSRGALDMEGVSAASPIPGSAINAMIRDRKSTRLNSSHGYISYAVFCLKKKKTNHTYTDHALT